MAKIQKFLNWIKFKLMYMPNIDFKTVKVFVDNYIEHLSNKEYEKFKTDINIIRSFVGQQLTLDSFVKSNTIKKLEKEFETINGSD